jgi:hypothetical protein
MSTNYRFINMHPGRHRLRDGTLGKEERNRKEWEIALKGHAKSAHNGEVLLSCAGCKELRRKVEAA